MISGCPAFPVTLLPETVSIESIFHTAIGERGKGREAGRAVIEDSSYIEKAMATDSAPVVPACVNHPEIETRLTCSSCGDPICARCMVSTVVGQKCPRCARQSSRARGTPDPLLVFRAFGAGVAVAAVGALLLLKVGLFGGILLAAGYGFLVGEAVRQAARKRVHSRLGATAAASVVIGLGGIAVVLSVPLLAPQVLLFLVVGGGVAFVRASGVW
jgi:hypothetical protein